MTDVCAIGITPLLTLEQALAKIRIEITPVLAQETIESTKAYGRVLAADMVSPINLPYATNAAMDGYAFSSHGISPDNVYRLILKGTAWAGNPYQGKIQSGQCVRIFTGAVLPEGTDTVVMQEQVTVEGQTIVFPAHLDPYENVRLAGEDVAQGDWVCAKRKILSAHDISFLAAVGICKVPVFRQLNIAYFSTGDELVGLNQTLEVGKIYDSNRYLLRGLLDKANFNVADLGAVPDDKAKLEQVIQHASEVNDVIISTGGASVGEADYVQEILVSCGTVSLWKIAVKPGKPLVFGKVGNCYYFGLPGNPVSASVIFQQVVSPMLSVLSGADEPKPLRIKAVCTTELKKSPGRLEFQRGILSQNAEGELSVASAGHQGSHILSTMSRSNCFIILPAENKGVNAGETVLVEPFSVLLD